MTNINQKVLMVGALAAAVMPEHHVYQLPGDNIGIKEKAPEKPKTLTGGDIKAIEKAKQKRAMRNKKRLNLLGA